jgi:hypothetical protein
MLSNAKKNIQFLLSAEFFVNCIFLGGRRLSYNLKVLLPKSVLLRKHGYITCETEGLICTVHTVVTGAVECK